MCVDSGSIFKAGPTRFAGGLDVGVRKNDCRASHCHVVSQLGCVRLVSLPCGEEKHLRRDPVFWRPPDESQLGGGCLWGGGDRQ